MNPIDRFPSLSAEEYDWIFGMPTGRGLSMIMPRLILSATALTNSAKLIKFAPAMELIRNWSNAMPDS